MKVVISAAGRFHAFQLAQQLNRQGYLKKIFTGAYKKSDIQELNKDLVAQHLPSWLIDQACGRLPFFSRLPKSSLYVFKDNLFDNWTKNKIEALGATDIFVGWAHYWFNSLPAIRKTGAKIVVECGSWHILEQAKILQQEYDLFGITLPAIVQKNCEKILQEYEAADYIMTPAAHVARSFIEQGVDSKKIVQVPYGVQLQDFVTPKVFDKKNKFRVLFVGSVGLQKGIQYLLQAWSQLALPESEAELCIIGPVEETAKKIIQPLVTTKNIKFIGPVAYEKLASFYAAASLFVLPSIQEGLAMVQAEAMASGLPVLCTTNTGGSEYIEDGKHGFIVSIRDATALAEKIEWCYNNREDSFVMGQRAQQQIQQFTWDHYGQKVVEAYKKMVAN